MIHNDTYAIRRRILTNSKIYDKVYVGKDFKKVVIKKKSDIKNMSRNKFQKESSQKSDLQTIYLEKIPNEIFISTLISAGYIVEIEKLKHKYKIKLCH